MNKVAVLVSMISIAGCSSHAGSGPGSGSDPEAVDAAVSAGCGSYGFKLAGAFPFASNVVTTATRDNAVIGVVGYEIPVPFALAIFDSLTATLDGLGTHDISDAHVDFLDMPANGVCETPGTCHGFVALSGSYVVTSIAPYQATFTLGDLASYDGSTTTPGAAIAGEVTGCVAVQ